MAEYAAIRNPGRCPAHPGALLREVIPATGKSRAGVWVRMQGAYDTWHAERDLADEIKKIPRLKKAAA